MFKRMMLSFSVIIVLMLLVLSISCGQLIATALNDEIRIAYLNEITTQQRRIQDEVNKLNENMLDFCNNTSLQSLIQAFRPQTDREQELQLDLYTESQIIQYANRMGFLGVTIVLPQNEIKLVWDKESKTLAHSAYADGDDLAAIGESAREPNITIYHVERGETSGKIRMIRGIYSTDDWNEVIGYLAVDVDLFPIVSGLMNSSSPMLLFTQDGQQIYPYYDVADREQIMEIAVPDIPARFSADKLYLTRTIPVANWSIISEISRENLYAKGMEAFRSMAAVAVLAFILAVLLSLFLSYKISKPIKTLSESMHAKKRLPERIAQQERGTPKELCTLYDSYNRLLGELDTLIDQVYVSKIKERESELAALQAQINPHLIYNTLDSINWLAFKYNAADIQEMARSLATMLRYSLNNGQSMIRLGDELKQLQSYFNIQSYRYRDRFLVTYRVDQAVLDRLIPKLILQPLAENALKHGLSEDVGVMKMIVSIEQQGMTLRLSLSNECAKSAYFTLQQALKSSAETPGHGYGIKNVNARLLSQYGPGHEIQYSYSPTAGIQAVIELPLSVPDNGSGGEEE